MNQMQYLIGKLRDSTFSLEQRYQDQIFDPRYGHHFPMFTQQTIKTMLLDSRVRYGLNLIKGPITTYTKFFNSEEAESPDIHTAIVELNYHFPYAVKAESKETEDFIIDQLNRFWEVGLSKAMTCVDWGYSGSEVFYKLKNGKMHFDNLHLYEPVGLRCVTRRKGIIGFTRAFDKTGYVPIGKGFWHVHQRERHRYYGESGLKGAHIPWHETWSLGGARDIRRTWFFKNAYDGGVMYYPEGSYTDEQGNVQSYQELAFRMLEAKRTGSGMAFPSTKSGTDRTRDWEYESPSSSVTPGGMEQYIDLLRDEILEGMGIPPEVVQSAGNDGMGSATGRMVPLMAFIASLTPIGTYLIGDFCQQILAVILKHNGMSDDYTIRRIVPKTASNAPGNSATPVQEQTVQDTGLAT